MPAYLLTAPNGVAGDVSRPDQTNVEPAMLVAASSVFAQSFGIPMKYVTGGIQQFNGGAETPASFAGILVREVPSISGNAVSTFTGNTPNPDAVQGLAVRGYMNVICLSGTPARGGDVYVQIVLNGARTVGSFHTTDDGANAILLDNVTWASDGKDADNNAEIRIAR